MATLDIISEVSTARGSTRPSRPSLEVLFSRPREIDHCKFLSSGIGHNDDLSLLYSEHKSIAPHIYTATHIFSNFKIGEKAYSYPLALGIYEALRRHELLDYDVIIPVPLSPDKAMAGELHRTRGLAHELSRLLAAPVEESLVLTKSISKRTMLSADNTVGQFEDAYYRSVSTKGQPEAGRRVLLVDDVVTKGSTMSQCLKRLLEQEPEQTIVLAAAGQMIVKAAVKDESNILE